MRIKHVGTLILAVLCGFGCAGSASSSREANAGAEQTYVGWVRFVGEFVLYDDRSAFLERRRANCISGALPLAAQRAAVGKFDGKRVRVRAVPVEFAIPESADVIALSMVHQGSAITNWCGGPRVLFATEMNLE
jgi:hypothetical protein